MKVENFGVKHIGFILDGNGRWAKKRGKERLYGHKMGVEAVRRTIDSISKEGRKMKKRAAEILLAIIIMARATGYLFSTICLQEVGVFTLLAERFLLAGCLLMLLLRKKLQWNRCTIGRGCLDRKSVV